MSNILAQVIFTVSFIIAALGMLSLCMVVMFMGYKENQNLFIKISLCLFGIGGISAAITTAWIL